MSNRIRALAQTHNDVGLRRHDLYREAYKRISKSISDEYFLEAITLTESLLTDRLESRVTFVIGENYSFKTLEKLIKLVAQREKDEQLKALVAVSVRSWKEKRNKALHEMAKIEVGDNRSWTQRMAELPEVAITGLKVLRQIDSQIKRLRTTKQAA
ncbi:MAG: hypothetical protein JSS39_13600 [Nitrospira sp.]|nr:hypothetical protein [Nitrospira sp.]